MAINEVLGAGRNFEHSRLMQIRSQLWPMWQALAKNDHDRVDRRSLRYVVHRYLLDHHRISVIGLEPLHANGSHDEAMVLTKYMPATVRSVIEGQAAREGFSLDDAVAMIVTLERLVQDSAVEILEAVYARMGLNMGWPVDRAAMHRVLESFMLRWMLGDDEASVAELEANETLRHESFEDWTSIVHFASGRLRAFEHEQLRKVEKPSGSSWSPLKRQFSLPDAQAIAGSITTSFGRYWETECARVKESLVRMDKTSSGRVRLSDFHGAALAGEWRFSESRDYLRQLGALDESSTWHGPRVIITNYLQSPSNCIVYSPHYRVCCANDCEDVLGEIEAAVQSPVASPEDILAIVSNVTVSLDDEPRLSRALKTQLHEIAKVSGGKIPIHGRLFSQWLHYTFPHACSFPHKSGTTTTLAPLEYGEDYMASEEEMSAHAETQKSQERVPSDERSEVQEEEWMLWSHEEELLDGTLKLNAPWESSSTSTIAMLVVASIVVALCLFGAKMTSTPHHTMKENPPARTSYMC